MRIRCNERFRPFSHTPGTSVVLPGTFFSFQIYPTKLFAYDLSNINPALLRDCVLKLSAPITEFTVQLDLERGWIKVWGKSLQGFFRYRIERTTDSWGIVVEKAPKEGLFESDLTKKHFINNSWNRDLLFLGCLKTQDWDAAIRRSSMSEIFPFWYRLGSYYLEHVEGSGGTLDLLANSFDGLKDAWAAGFKGILSPAFQDFKHQGFSLSCDQLSGSPIALLQKGALCIRSLLIDEAKGKISILPHLPPEFHCGKWLRLQASGHDLDIEWTKKSIRRIVIRAGKTEALLLTLPSKVRRFRLNGGSTLQAGDLLNVEAGSTYFLDRFEK